MKHDSFPISQRQNEFLRGSEVLLRKETASFFSELGGTEPIHVSKIDDRTLISRKETRLQEPLLSYHYNLYKHLQTKKYPTWEQLGILRSKQKLI